MTKEKRLKKRHNAEKRFRFYGLASIFLALLFVLILVQNIFSKGSSAFMKTAINVDVFYDPELLGVKNGATKDEILEADFFDITIETLLKTYPTNNLDEENQLIDLFTTDAELEIKNFGFYHNFGQEVSLTEGKLLPTGTKCRAPGTRGKSVKHYSCLFKESV